MVLSRQRSKSGGSGRWRLGFLGRSDPKAAFQLRRESRSWVRNDNTGQKAAIHRTDANDRCGEKIRFAIPFGLFVGGAMRNSSLAPLRPRNLMCSKRSVVFRCAKSISTSLSLRDRSNSGVSAI